MATPLLPAMRWRRRRPSYSAVTSHMPPAGNRLCYSLVTKFARGVPPGQTAFYSEPERSMIAPAGEVGNGTGPDRGASGAGGVGPGLGRAGRARRGAPGGG